MTINAAGRKRIHKTDMRKFSALLTIALLLQVGCNQPTEPTNADLAAQLANIQFKLDLIIRPVKVNCWGDPHHDDGPAFTAAIDQLEKMKSPYGRLLEVGRTPCYMLSPGHKIPLGDNMSIYGGHFYLPNKAGG